MESRFDPKSNLLTIGLRNCSLQKEVEHWDSALQGAYVNFNSCSHIVISRNYLYHDHDGDDETYLTGVLQRLNDLVMGASGWYHIWLRSGHLSWSF